MRGLLRSWPVRYVLGAAIIAAVLAPFVAGRFEKQLTQPTAQIMTFLLTGKLAEHTFMEGVPYVYYRRLGEEHANPVYASVYAFWYYQQWLHSQEFDYFLDYYNVAAPRAPSGGYEEYFFNVANWLVNNVTEREFQGKAFGVWEYHFPWEIYQLEESWVSGMAQGLAIQVLLRAWQQSGNEKYLEGIRLALDSFGVPMAAGGVTLMDSDDAWWYEEYASPEAIESRVFNGAAHAVIALLELATATGDEQAQVLAERGLQSLVASLDVYDAGWWTYYDALGLMANYKYHHVNINLARHLAQSTGNAQLLAAANKWAAYKEPFFVREFVKQRPQFADVGLLLLAWGISFVILVLLFTGARFVRRGLGKEPRAVGV